MLFRILSNPTHAYTSVRYSSVKKPCITVFYFNLQLLIRHTVMTYALRVFEKRRLSVSSSRCTAELKHPHLTRAPANSRSITTRPSGATASKFLAQNILNSRTTHLFMCYTWPLCSTKNRPKKPMKIISLKYTFGAEPIAFDKARHYDKIAPEKFV